MKSETELRQYFEKVRIQTIAEEKKEHWYLVNVGKTIMSVLMYVLDDKPIDLNYLERGEK